jgi:glycerol-3-phosphate dehydrogenase subunit C
MREGSLEAPIRHIIDWTDPDFINQSKIDEEMRRVFDICHGCRRCFNLCDSFPKLFDLVDESKTGELDGVDSKDFALVADACTLCDMCFSNKCPYVPPHEFNIDFPHLMLRYKAAEFQENKTSFVSKELAKTDRNGKFTSLTAPITNWATKTNNKLTRSLMEKTIGIHKEAVVPKFDSKTLVTRVKEESITINKNASAYGQKAVIYATCFGNYNNPSLGLAARAVLVHNGVEVEVVYPGCCGMPSLEQGDLQTVSHNASQVAKELRPWIEKGYTIIAPVPSCALMLKQEWPLISPHDENVSMLSQATKDISEYIVELSKNFGLVSGLKALGEDITLHLACHARAQNIGQKGAEMLRLIPDTKVTVIERCSGHGGTWGMMVDHFETAIKVGKPAARQAIKNGNSLVLSECPLAGSHLLQGIEKEGAKNFTTAHPIEIFARAYELVF